MALIEISILELILSIFAIISAIIFIFAYLKRKDLFLWLFAYISLTLGYIFNFLRIYSYIFESISIIAYAVSLSFVILATFNEYSKTFYNKTLFWNKIPVIFLVFSFEDIFTFIVIILAISLLLISLSMLLRIFFKERSLTHIFQLLSVAGALFSLTGNILIAFNVQGAQEVNIGADILFITILMITGLVIIVEERIMESERRYKNAYNNASFYRDLVAHDINNILQNVRSASELISISLKKKDLLVGHNNFLKIIEEQVLRGSKLVSDVKKLSDLEDVKIKLEAIDLCDILKQAIAYIKSFIQDKELSLSVTSEIKNGVTLANELLLDVFENIMLNAVKHNTHEMIEILVKVSSVHKNSKDYYQIDFIDNGIGIPDDIKPMIFDRIYKREKKVGGMGLGLSLVKSIVKRYNGDIWVENRIKEDFSQGSNFIVILPKL